MISYGTTATGGALVEDIGNNWTRIIPQDGSPEYYWNTTTNIRQWESPLTDIYSAGLGAVAQPGYGGYGGEVLGQHAGYIQQQHFQQQQQYTPKDQQPPRRQPPPQQQRAPAQTAGHGGAARQPAPSRAAEWAKQQSAGGNIDPLSIFVRNLDPKATSEEIRDFFSRFGRVAEVAHQHNFKRQSSGPAYAFVRYDKENSVRKALRSGTLLFKGRTVEVRPRHYRPGDKDAPHAATVAHTDTRRSGGGVGRDRADMRPVGPRGLPDDDDEIAESPVGPCTVYLTSLSWETGMGSIEDYCKKFGNIRVEKKKPCIHFKENFVTSSAGKKRHSGVLVEFEKESAAAAATSGKQAFPAEIDGRAVKVWRPVGRDMAQEWASLASISSQIRLLVENSGSRSGVRLEDIPRLYKKMYGKDLQATDYSFPTLPHLIYSMTPTSGGLTLETSGGAASVSTSSLHVRLADRATPIAGAPHSHLLPCHSFSHTNLKSPCVEQGRLPKAPNNPPTAAASLQNPAQRRPVQASPPHPMPGSRRQLLIATLPRQRTPRCGRL